MRKNAKPMLDVLSGKKVKRTPIWLMRQAGRYLPEYRKIRGEAGSFLDLCFNPELAAEVTLQPIRRFSLDAAIIFADILLLPHALGRDLSFYDGEGPVLEAVNDESDLNSLSWNVDMLSPVFSALELVKRELPPGVALIGFSGSPWTVACYMTGEKGRDGFKTAVAMARDAGACADGGMMARLLDVIHDATVEYLGRQIEAGADVIQLFDSWAGLLSGEAFERMVVEPTRKLVAAINSEYPDVPVIGFPRGAGKDEYLSYALKTGVKVLGIDQNVELQFARDVLQKKTVLQGNLSPDILIKGGDEMKHGVRAIMENLVRKNHPHIFNLGHGVLPETPPEHVAELVDLVHGWSMGQ